MLEVRATDIIMSHRAIDCTLALYLISRSDGAINIELKKEKDTLLDYIFFFFRIVENTAESF